MEEVGPHVESSSMVRHGHSDVGYFLHFSGAGGSTLRI